MPVPACSRREFLGYLAVAGVAGSFLGWEGCRPRGSGPPNILFLFADDQRFDTIRALGNPHIQTPHLDALVKRGTVFRQAYIMGSQSGAVCIPSRAMLLTGKSLFLLQNKGSVIPEEHAMWPELLRKAGYTTFATGKWHSDRAAFARCYSAADEVFFGGMSDHWNVPVYHFDPSGKYAVQTPVIEKPQSSNAITFKNYDHIAEGKNSSELFSEAVISFLDSYRGRAPFLAYVAYTAPHDPRTAPQAYLDMYDPASIPLPKNFLPEHPFDIGDTRIRDELLAGFPRTKDEIRKHIAEYYAAITHLDAQIGRVLEALKRSGREKDTVIVFSGDNGLAIGQHGLMGKQNLYEHSVHVPLNMSGPGIPVGTERDALCYLNDIGPTLCDLAGIAPPRNIWGTSLVPVLRDPEKSPREALVFAYKNYLRGLRWKNWKLILTNVQGKRFIQLFDLGSDPKETKNLAGDPELRQFVGELTERTQGILRAAGDAADFSLPDWGLPPEQN
jgi:arylsulfatase A-like enzyme